MKQLFDKVAIIGPGLIGGSIALGIKKRGLARHVIGIGHQKTSIDNAIEKEAIDEGTLDIAEGVRDADIVILATPVSLIVEHAREALKHMKPSAILTDVGSAKSFIVTEINKILRPDIFFVGGHPIAGSEHRGVDWIDADLFEKSMCILTPDGPDLNDATKTVASMWESLGAKVECMSLEEHDEVLAYVSHLPHLMASLLINTVKEDYTKYAGNGLKSTTRIASSDPDLWLGIFNQNRGKLINAIEAFEKKISDIKAALSNKDDETILEMLKEGKRIRDAYPPGKNKNI